MSQAQIKEQIDVVDAQYRDIVETTDSFFVRWEAESDKIIYCNQPYADRWSSTVENLIGRSMYEIRGEEACDSLRAFMADIKPGESRTSIFTTTVADGTTRSARTFTRAISHDGVTTVEYQTNGYDCTEERVYMAARDKLFAIFSDEALGYQQKLEHLLEVGLEYYQLDTAVVSMIVGDSFEVKCALSNTKQAWAVGTEMNLQDTFCGQFVENESQLAVDDVSHSDIKHLPCCQNSDVESFIGASIHTANGPYGAVNFTSSTPRGKPYSAEDNSFLLFIGNWIGLLIGNQEQIDFMSNQSEYYQSLFQTVPAMMFLSDADGLIISASNRLCQKLGFDPDLLPGKNCHSAFNIDDKPGLKAALLDGEIERFPLTLTLPDGECLEVELNCSIKNVGTLQGLRMVVLTDVSERNKASRSVEEQNRLLETANENLNQFAFIASHDLQEPLRKIQQFSSFLEDDLDGELNEEASYHLKVIVEASNRMSTLIHDLLRFSGASQEEPQHEPVSLNKLLEEVTRELDITIEESGAIITIEALPDVKGDKGMLRQLFVNLISNGIKYRSKTRPLKITVKALGADLQEGVSVSDNGIGFEMEFARKIFEPFNRLHRNKDYKGNGIGLAICSTVCDKHSWRLSAESEPDVGSTFLINFTQ